MIPVLAKGHLPATPSIPPLSSHFFEQNFPLASHFLTVAPPPEIVRANEYTGCVKVPFPLYKPTHPPHTPHSLPVYKPTHPLHHTPLNPSLPLVQHCLLEALQCCCIRKGRVVEDALHSKLYASLLRVLSALLPEVCGYVTHARFLCVCVCALECAEHFAYLIMWWRMFSPLQAARTLCCCACCAC